jgi:hypothetical protein
MNRSLARTIGITTAIALTSLGSVSVAQARQGTDDGAAHRVSVSKSPRVTETKMCGSIATKLKVSGEDAGAQIEYELDQNVNGKTWSLTLKQNGKTAGSATRKTKAPSGSLHWRLTTGGASTGTFSVTAKNGSKTCSISATL